MNIFRNRFPMTVCHWLCQCSITIQVAKRRKKLADSFSVAALRLTELLLPHLRANARSYVLSRLRRFLQTPLEPSGEH
jgi:hypothetical protein